MGTKTEAVTVRLTKEQRRKLEHLAESARSSESWVIQSLIENSQLVAGAMFVGSTPLPLLQKQNGEVQHG